MVAGQGPDSLAPMESDPGRCRAGGGRGGLTARGLGWVVLTSLAVLGVVGGGGLTWPARSAWVALILGALGLWAGWLYWRTAMADRDVPGHLLHPFLGAVLLILLGHLLAGAGTDPQAGRLQLLNGDTSLLTRLLILALLVLMAQDVFSRVGELRWGLTACGVVLAVGNLLRLLAAGKVPGAAAITLSGLTGVGMLLSPLLLPMGRPGGLVASVTARRLRSVATVARVSAATVLASLLLTAQPEGGAAFMIAFAAVGGALLLSAVFLRAHRGRLAALGVVLMAVAVVGAVRMGASLPGWLARLEPLGMGGRLARPEASGAQVLGFSAGWLGLGLVVAGLVVSLVWSLRASVAAAKADQARSALWAAVVAVSGCALLGPGGLSVPSVTVTAGLTWGLVPRMMVHRVRRFHGLPVMVAFGAALAVLALEQRTTGTTWDVLARRYGDGAMHLFATFMLAGVLFWQVRAGRWWQALACALAAGLVASAGELAQGLLSTRAAEWSDVAWDFLGAAGALGVFLLLSGVMWVERRVASTPRVSAGKYDPLHSLAAQPFEPVGASPPPPERAHAPSPSVGQ